MSGQKAWPEARRCASGQAGKIYGLLRWGIQERAKQTGPIREGAVAAYVERVFRIPLRGVGKDHIVGIQVRSVVILHAFAQSERPLGQVSIR